MNTNSKQGIKTANKLYLSCVIETSWAISVSYVVGLLSSVGQQSLTLAKYT
ncbi:Uncharacterised protein [Yersinia intermedia]|uniref:Uncharacterized protein n=1 Tax=Yersinia kristensenii TaxID=28152 RepID=A0A0T9KXS1_YERKR|nr:Uncharacterised protein [Yersinia intermedia]CNE39461.1 Uncharacterised protein [Yersinia kristensenii]CNH04647.1 Uncharacterised protein [Yersinia intermedia]